MNKNFENLKPEDVITLKNETDKVLINHTTFLVEELTDKFGQSTFHPPEKAERWLNTGIEVKVLTAGKSWRNGKVKLVLQFCPDQPESPLDEFRQ
jgi:hypothetical protein